MTIEKTIILTRENLRKEDKDLAKESITWNCFYNDKASYDLITNAYLVVFRETGQFDKILKSKFAERA